MARFLCSTSKNLVCEYRRHCPLSILTALGISLLQTPKDVAPFTGHAEHYYCSDLIKCSTKFGQISYSINLCCPSRKPFQPSELDTLIYDSQLGTAGSNQAIQLYLTLLIKQTNIIGLALYICIYLNNILFCQFGSFLYFPIIFRGPFRITSCMKLICVYFARFLF